MPDLFDQSKTEAPTPRRREKARLKGQVARSSDLSSGAIVLSALGVLWFASHFLGRMIADVVRSDLGFLQSTDIDAEWVTQVASGHAMQFMAIALPVVLSAGAVSLGLGLSQSGFSLSSDLLTPDTSRLAPAKGIQRLASMASVVRGGFDVLKLLGIGSIVWVFVQANAAEFSRIDRLSPPFFGGGRFMEADSGTGVADFRIPIASGVIRLCLPVVAQRTRIDDVTTGTEGGAQGRPGRPGCPTSNQKVAA